MELFDDIGFPRPAGRFLPHPWPDADTPLGILVTSVILDGVAVTGELPAEMRGPAPDVSHYRWHGPVARCELLRIPFAAADVEGAVGFAWRLATWREVGEVVFACRWEEPPPAEMATSPAPGFEIAVWTGHDRVVAIGTEDWSRLSHRAALNDGLPARIVDTAEHVGLHAGPERCDVTVASLDRHEHCQIQFVVAWGTVAHPGAVRHAVCQDPGTLFALSRAHGENPRRAEP